MYSPLFTTSIVLEGVVAGLFVGSSMTEHAVKRLSAPDWIAFNQAKDRLYGPVMPAVFVLTLIAAVAPVIVLEWRVLQALAVLALLIAGIITIVIHLPLNQAFQSWSPSTYPAGWDKQRRRWRNWNYVRTILTLIAFVLTVLPAAIRDNSVV